MVGTQDSEALQVVPHGHGNHFFYKSISSDALGLLHLDIARRKIDVIDRRQDQLQRTALGAND